MSSSTREFTCTDPFETEWNVKFLWHQVGIAIRHGDTIDCKFYLTSRDGETKKVVAIPHPFLKEFARMENRPITDAWVIRLASAHMRYMIETGDDMDKTLVTVRMSDLHRCQSAVSAGR